ncbi:MAG: DUF4830 domain-containing protein [Acetanaerobacterium sp.]
MSMKLEKRKMLLIGVVVVGVILLSVGLWKIFSGKGADRTKVSTEAGQAANNAQRVTYLEGFGWDVSDEPIEVCEIILPESFDEVYKRYNEIQKTQGMDLEKHKGRRAKRWTYLVLNYPSDDEVHANVIVCDDKVVAGDICSVALGGFIHGFSPEETGTLSENGLLATDLPIELNGIRKAQPKEEQQDASSEAPESENDGNTGEGEAEGTQDNDENTPNENETAELIDEVQRQTQEEIENALEMLIQAAGDQED